jgi:hypothetical protein
VKSIGFFSIAIILYVSSFLSGKLTVEEGEVLLYPVASDAKDMKIYRFDAAHVGWIQLECEVPVIHCTSIKTTYQEVSKKSQKLFGGNLFDIKDIKKSAGDYIFYTYFGHHHKNVLSELRRLNI